MEEGKGPTKDELADLGGGECAFEHLGDADLEGGEGVVEVHDGVDQGVENDKDPDWWRGESNSGPHGEHCTCVVVGLQKGGLLALGQDDEGVDDFVEFGEIEEEAKVGETLFPDSFVDVAKGSPESGGSGGGVGSDETALAVEEVTETVRSHTGNRHLRNLKDGSVNGSRHSHTGPG